MSLSESSQLGKTMQGHYDNYSKSAITILQYLYKIINIYLYKMIISSWLTTTKYDIRFNNWIIECWRQKNIMEYVSSIKLLWYVENHVMILHHWFYSIQNVLVSPKAMLQHMHKGWYVVEIWCFLSFTHV